MSVWQYDEREIISWYQQTTRGDSKHNASKALVSFQIAFTVKRNLTLGHIADH